MYKTLLALLFSGIGLSPHADDSYLIQVRIRDVKDGTLSFLKTIQHAADYKRDATRRRKVRPR